MDATARTSPEHPAEAAPLPGAAPTGAQSAAPTPAVTDLIRTIIEGVAAETGESFFHCLAEHLARALQADFTVIGELAAGPRETIRTVAVCAGGTRAGNLTYDLAGTPCENVVGRGVSSYPRGVADLFPDDSLLRELGVEGYVGVPLFDSHHRPLGNMVALFRRPLEDPGLAEAILQVFSTRTAAEIERRRTEQALRESEDLLRATLESTADGILVVDNDRRVTHANARFAELWRIPEELMARHDDTRLLAFVVDQLQDPEAFLAKVHELYGTDRTDFDTLHFKDGRVFERYSCPLVRAGGVCGRVWSFRDMSRRHRAEEERRSLEAQMQQAQKLESLGVLAGGVAHDFNNLLTAILCNADLALAQLPEIHPSRRAVSAVVKTSQRAADLCRQLLAYSGGGRFVLRAVNLSELVREVAHLLEISISKKAELHYDFQAHLPPVAADAGQLCQVLMNLILNASEALEGQEGTITVSTRAVDAEQAAADRAPGSPLPEGALVCLEVRDTGCGMDAETQARIFDPFFTTKFTGRGLGLAAVLGIVRGHGGAIRIESRPGQGTAFRIYLPADASAGSGEAEPEEEAHLSSGIGTLLLVDDEEAVRETTRELLEVLGYRVLAAADGRAAVELFQQHAGEIDVVLLDLTMPHMDGEETLRELRKIRGDVRVIICSGYHERDVARRFAGRSPSGYLQKPYRPADLSKALDWALREV
ncbi:MAG TPA: response regulator [Candidatus Saccharimonadales bacterium]|nr:response regulator [Candidatus Saccharimonadales bacterium]